MSYVIPPSTGVPLISKDPDASLRYGVDVAHVLHPSDAVSGVTASSDFGISVTDAASDGTLVMARVSGGTPGVKYAVTFSWTTAAGDADQRTIHIAVGER